MSQVASRYARALFQALQETRTFEEARPVLSALAELSQELAERLDDPTIPLPSRENALRVALGNPASDTLWSRLVELLARKRRLGAVNKICRIALDLERIEVGQVDGTVVSRDPLDAILVTRLETELSATGRKVQLTNAIDSSILGGFRVELGATVLDATINNQLRQARKALLSA